LTEVQSAIGRLQLRKLDSWVKSRRRHARIFNEVLVDAPGLRLTIPPAGVEHSYYKYYAFVEPDQLKTEWSRDRIIEELNARGVTCMVGSCSEIYLEKAFPQGWRPKEPLPVARRLGETSLMFLVHPTLAEEQVQRAAEIVRDLMQEVAR
jgi:dTDP-4-amino-4,6-dideoxygalactose transaminase